MKSLAGGLLAGLMPGRVERISRDFTGPYWEREPSGSRAGRLIDSLIRYHLAHAGSGHDEGKTLESIHKNFWSDKRDVEWFERSSLAFESRALPHLQAPVTELAARLAEGQFARICEIGTGDGRFLEYLSQNLGQTAAAYVGLDLSAERMALNRDLYPDFEFQAGDAAQWIREHGVDGTLYVTNGGVFEYFRQASLVELFAFIGRTQPHSAIALFFEPVVADHDMRNELDSRLTTAGEYSFSHNYAHILARSGFRLGAMSDDSVAGYRAVTLYATPEPE
jgi:trans-aconitate methyltransferase